MGVVQSCSQDQDSDSLRMVGGKDRPVLKLKDMEEKHLHNLFLKNMSGLIEEVKNPTPRLNPNSKCGGMATHAGLAIELGITRKKGLSRRWRPSSSGASAGRGSTTMSTSRISPSPGLTAALSVLLSTTSSPMHSTSDRCGQILRRTGGKTSSLPSPPARSSRACPTS